MDKWLCGRTDKVHSTDHCHCLRNMKGCKYFKSHEEQTTLLLRDKIREKCMCANYFCDYFIEPILISRDIDDLMLTKRLAKLARETKREKGESEFKETSRWIDL